jgi:hypothetical protein
VNVHRRDDSVLRIMGDGVLVLLSYGTPVSRVVFLFVCIAWRIVASIRAFWVTSTRVYSERGIARRWAFCNSIVQHEFKTYSTNFASVLLLRDDEGFADLCFLALTTSTVP